MFSLVRTNNPSAVEAEVQKAYLAMFPKGDRSFVPRIFGWATECFTGSYGDYLAVDARYHDFEHTLQGTLCMARLLRGRQRAGVKPALPQRVVELGLLGILLHDTGYLKHKGDAKGTGAKYTITHVARSADFAESLLREKMGFSNAEIKAVRNMIACTGVDAKLESIPFASEAEKITGFALATADLLGQMAAPDYVEKLPELFSEFAEAARFTPGKSYWVASFSKLDDLLERTPSFWKNYVLPKLDHAFGGLYRFLSDPYPAGRNEYLEHIEENMAKIRPAATARQRSKNSKSEIRTRSGGAKSEGRRPKLAR